MRIAGILFASAALCAVVGCSEPEPSGTLELEPPEDTDEKIPEDASLAELQALPDEKVDKDILPEERAKKLLKVLESADAHNKRLEHLDQRLFGENSY